MATIGPRQPVNAPVPQSWRPSLIRAARAAGMYFETPVNLADSEAAVADAVRERYNLPANASLEQIRAALASSVDRWANGIAYRPELSWFRNDEIGPGSYIECATSTETSQADKSVVRGSATVEWDPYVLYEGDTCTTMGSDYATTRDRAVGSLQRQTSHMVEEILWTGIVNGIDFTVNHPNTALASADAELPGGSTALGVVEAMGLMTQELSETLGGVQGMIHVPAYLIPLLDFYGLITRVGTDTNWLYAGDHMIVTGTGYDGSGPSGQVGGILEGNAWIYGTSFVEVRVSGVFPAPSEDQVYVDMDTDDIIVLAERLALASWDRTAHVGINVCLTDPGPTCDVSS